MLLLRPMGVLARNALRIDFFACVVDNSVSQPGQTQSVDRERQIWRILVGILV